MCGIAGILSTTGEPVGRETLHAMAETLHHRGPDDDGVWIDGAVGLAHRRLAVIDLADGHQPMLTPDGTLAVVFNGEIYNFRELRKALEKDGAVFRTHSDTEVLLHLYERYGADLLQHLNGMFAFAIADRRRNGIFLARDRFGQKPLHYFFRRGRFVFASELTALRGAPGFSPEIREQSVHDFLTFQYVPPPHTVFRAVYKLPPASWLWCDADQTEMPEPQRYWQLDFSRKQHLSLRKAADRLRPLLEDAVRLRLVSDVPLGAFLSGGVDSSIIAGLMTRTASSPVDTYTIGFGDERYDETAQAAEAARFLGTRHHVKHVNPQHFDIVTRLVRHYGEPFCDASMLPTYLLSAFTRRTMTVSLSGDGADEIFGGYYRYLVYNLARGWDLLPRGLRRKTAEGLLKRLPPMVEERTTWGKLVRLIRLAGSTEADRYLDIINRFPDASKQGIYGPRMRTADLEPSAHYFRRLFAACSSRTYAEGAAEVDVHSYLPGDILTKVDIASMASSLEVRSPFLDYRVAEFMASLPWSLKQSFGRRKCVLRAACRDLLPPTVKTAPKRGFGVPLAQWFRGEWRPVLEDYLLGGGPAKRGFFCQSGLEELVRRHVSGQADHSYSLWALLVFEIWCREFRI